MKKKTPTQKYIDQAIDKAKEELSGNNISNCNITQTIETGEAIIEIASALEVNARALGDLAKSIGNQPIYGFYVTTEEIKTM
jgi:hypothetical protein